MARTAEGAAEDGGGGRAQLFLKVDRPVALAGHAAVWGMGVEGEWGVD